MFSDMNIMIMYPTNSTSLVLGRRLMTAGHNLSFYCPSQCNLRQAGTIPADLRIASFGLGTTVQTSVDVQLFPDVDFVIFPTLDVLPHNDRASFGRMCEDLFR